MALNGNLTGSAQYFNDDDFYSGVATTSLRFDEGSTAMLVRTPSSAGNRRTFTISMWVKISDVVGTHILINAFASADPNNQGLVRFSSSALQFTNFSGEYDLVTNRLFRDSSAWYHLVFAVDTTQGTAANRIKIYVNGVQETSFSTETYPDQNLEMEWNNTVKHLIGARTDNDTPSPIQRYDGYMAEVNLVDGNAYDPTYFGETKNGVWIAKKYSGSYGTNGFRLQFDQVGVGTASTSTIGADTSGNTHHFTSSNIVASDCAMPDSPENNFAVLNALDNDGNTRTGLGLTEGNLKGASTVNGWDNVRSTFTMPTGKWYVELLSTSGIGNGNSNISIMPSEDAMDYGVALGSNFAGWTSTVWAYSSNGGLYNNYGGTSQPVTAGSNSTKWAADAIVALTFDGSTLKFYRNNSLIYTVGSIPSNDYAIMLGFYDTDESGIINFGQDSSFAGEVTAQGNTDENGIGDFYYAPPSGFLALCSANLPEPTIGPNSLTQATDHFNTVLWTGDGQSGQAITGVGFKPDWVWIKERNSTSSHALYDSSRGVKKQLESNTTDAETNYDSNLLSFDTDGVTLGGSGATNQNNNTFVGWNWKANGGTTVTNNDGDGTSTVQANTTAGFSIVTYTGSSNESYGHGLDSAPEMIIVKGRNVGHNWAVYHQGVQDGTANGFLELNTTAAKATGSNPRFLNGTTSTSQPTNTVFNVNHYSGSSTNASNNSDTYIAYCFHSVEGYSKFGSYTGNGNADGAFVFTGFRPAWILVKRTDSTNNWVINDTTRATFNEITGGSSTLYADTSNQESDLSTNVDFLSNGFKTRTTGGHRNASGGTYIYMAFAETPFKYANAR